MTDANPLNLSACAISQMPCTSNEVWCLDPSSLWSAYNRWADARLVR